MEHTPNRNNRNDFKTYLLTKQNDRNIHTEQQTLEWTKPATKQANPLINKTNTSNLAKKLNCEDTDF